jgi:ribosomal protein S27AE
MIMSDIRIIQGVKINTKNNEAFCPACGNWTFSNSFVRQHRVPLQCSRCKKYFQQAKRLK